MHLKHLALFVLLPFTITGQHAFSQNQLILLQPSGDQGGTFAYNLAPDGSYVAGDLNLSPNGARAHRWSTSGAAMNLGLLHGNGSSIAYSVSNGGGVVVGDSFTSATGVNEAFRWTPSDGMQGLGFLPGFTQSFANDVSADGTTIVGASSISGSGQAFRYTVNEGMQPLITMPGNYVFATGQAVSADGSVIAGHTETSFGSYRTFRWTAQTGMVDLGFGGDVGDISSDGSIIVGGTGAGPFKWTQAGGLMMLPLNDGIATGVTANGMTIVGNGQFGQSGPDLPFIWDPQMGLRQLQSYLQTEVGLNLGGFSITSVQSISDDGRVIAGFGQAGSFNRGFVAIVPCPMVSLVPFMVLWSKTRRRDA